MNKYTSLAKLYDSFSLDLSANKWAEYIDALLKESGIKKGMRILDIGCGTGNVSLELYKKGYNLIALDNSSDMLEVAAQRFAKAGAKIQIVNQDMTDMKLHGKFDAVVCINDGINYITQDANVLKVLNNIYDVLDGNGTFLFDISSQYKLKAMHEKSYFEENDEGLYIWHNEYDEKSDILTMDLSLYTHLEDDLYEKSLETHKQKAHDIEFLSSILDQTGFTDIGIYDGFSHDKLKPDSQRIQFSAHISK